MKISELTINKEVYINGFPHLYKGIQKIRKPGFGTVQQIVFKDVNSGVEKHFNINLMGKQLKINNGLLEF